MTNGSFNHFYILSSLKHSEEYTATALFDFIQWEKDNNNLNFDLSHIKFEGIADLRRVLAEINQSTINGEKPLIHFECHGDEDDGLYFKDNTEIPWRELSAILLEINLSSAFNLLIGLAACYGTEFFGNMSPLHPCPCLGVYAPANEVDPGEVMSGARKFYGTLLRTGNISEANQELMNAQGAWYMLTADYFYLGAIRHYIINHCTPEKLLPFIKEQQSKLLKTRIRKTTIQLKHELNQWQGKHLIHDYFDKYFSTYAIPENKLRFNYVKNQVKEAMTELRGTGKYWI